MEISEFKTKGFVSLEYPKILRERVNITFQSWKQFCDLPNEVKKGLPYSNSADGVGYELKEGIGNKADRKENFDVAIYGKNWLERNTENFWNPMALKFVQDSISLVELIEPTIIDFAARLQEEFKLENLLNEVKQNRDVFFIRFIHYFGNREIGEETAAAHIDQSGFTLHLFESDPGLQCLTYDKEWVDMPVSSNETVIIPAMQMQLRSNGELRALCHRVIATEETATNGRYSAVCFVQLKHTSKYNKERFGRLQEMNPGFNYSISIDEFKKFFI